MIFFILIAVILLYPFALFAAKRIFVFGSLKHICKKKGLSLIKTHFADIDDVDIILCEKRDDGYFSSSAKKQQTKKS